TVLPIHSLAELPVEAHSALPRAGYPGSRLRFFALAEGRNGNATRLAPQHEPRLTLPRSESSESALDRSTPEIPSDPSGQAVRAPRWDAGSRLSLSGRPADDVAIAPARL